MYGNVLRQTEFTQVIPVEYAADLYYMAEAHYGPMMLGRPVIRVIGHQYVNQFVGVMLCT